MNYNRIPLLISAIIWKPCAKILESVKSFEHNVGFPRIFSCSCCCLESGLPVHKLPPASLHVYVCMCKPLQWHLEKLGKRTYLSVSY